MGLGLVVDAELGELVALVMAEFGGERLFRLTEVGLDGPVFAGLEFSISSSRSTIIRKAGLCTRPAEAGPDFLPQQRRKIEPHQVIEGAPRLLGVDQIHGHVARVLYRLLNGALGDFVEDHPADLFVAQQFFSQQFAQMPGDGLAFAIRVGGEVERFGLAYFLGDGGEVLFVLFDGLMLHGEVVGRIDRALFGQQIADMAIGGEDGKVLAQVFLDGFALAGDSTMTRFLLIALY